MTMKELALLANVSPSTVTKAFSDAPDISAQTKEHIYKIAKQYGCYGSFIKKKYSKSVIAVICPELYGGLYPRYVKTFLSFIEKQGGIAVMGDYNFDYEKQSELIEYFASYIKVDGIFCFNIRKPLKKGYNIPIINIGKRNIKDICGVSIDISKSISEAISHLKALGHTSIAFFGEERTEAKALAFQRCAHGRIAQEIFISSKRFEKAGMDCAEQMLNSGKEYTAVICAYDDIAVGAINYFINHGLSVPEDISVIGMDNNVLCEHTTPRLSSIDMQFDKICQKAWELFIKSKGKPFIAPYKNIIVESRLVLRETTAVYKPSDKPLWTFRKEE